MIQGNVPHDDVDTGNPLKIGGKAASGTPTAVSNGDRVNAWFNLNGALKTDPTGTTSQPVTFTTPVPVTGDTAHDAPDTGSPIKIGGKASSGTPTAVANGDRVDAWLGLNGQVRTDPTGATTQPVSIAATVSVQGDVAHDGVDSGNPIKIGGKTVATATAPTAVATGDRTDAVFDRHGKQLVDPNPANPLYVHDTITTTTPVDQIAAPGANKAIVVRSYMIKAAGSNAGTTRLTLQFDTASDPIFSSIESPGGGGALMGKWVGPTNKKLTATVGTASRTGDFHVAYEVMDV